MASTGSRSKTKTPSWDSLVRNVGRGDVFHVIDVETTGSSAAAGRVIEVACLSAVRGEVVGRFETLIDPGEPIPPFITRLTGITTAMAKTGLGPTSAMMKLESYLAARPGHFVAHNAGFDYGFLAMEFQRAGLAWPFAGRYCTVRLGRHAVPGLGRYNLDRLIEHFGIRVLGTRHRAMADVEATNEAFWKMVALLDGGLELVVPQAPAIGPAVGPAIGPMPGDDGAWRRLIGDLALQSRTLAAMLEQHGALTAVAPGTVALALPEPFYGRLDPARRAMLELAVGRVFGDGTALTVGMG